MNTELRYAGDIPLYYAPDQALRRFCLCVYVKAGAIYESRENNGYAHLFEHIVFRNLKKQYGDGFYTLLAQNAVDFNASTHKSVIQFTFSGLPRGIPLVCEIIALMFSALVVNTGEFNIEKSRIKAEYKEDEPHKRFSYLCGQTVWAGSTARQDELGYLTNINRASLSSLDRYRREVISRGNVFAVATGCVSRDELDMLSKALASVPLSDAPIKEKTVDVPARYLCRDCTMVVRDDVYTYLHFSFDLGDTAAHYHLTDFLYFLLFFGYDSVLQQELSEKRALIYGFDSGVERYRNIGILDFSFEVYNHRLEEAMTAVVDTLNRVKSGDFDYDTTIQKLVTDHTEILDDIEGLNWDIAYHHLLFGQTRDGEAELKTLMSINKGEIAAFAAELFRTDRLVLGLKGNKRAIDKNRDKLKAILQKLDI